MLLRLLTLSWCHSFCRSMLGPILMHSLVRLVPQLSLVLLQIQAVNVWKAVSIDFDGFA